MAQVRNCWDAGKALEDAFTGAATPDPERDVLTQHLWEAIPPETLRSLTPEQYHSLKQAFQTAPRKHTLDLRGVIPLYFTQFYFVFLFGVDRRRETREVVYDRRQAVREGTARLIGGVALGVFLTVLGLSAFALWYLLKCLVGTDILPGVSLSRYLRQIL
ncbi:MAG: hypothetical protein WHS44_12410 [Fimbriimonadales bacterium]|nr:MAG: hypothetical protein KatS3mg018_2103 [Fimbriimonadales bacterium]